jgi:hypothetical protein
MNPAVQNTDAKAFQLTGTLYILWLSMVMEVSTALQLILSKMVNPCLTMSPQIQGAHLLLLYMTEAVKEHLQTSNFVNFHHVPYYPPCTYTVESQLYMDSVGYSFYTEEFQVTICVIVVTPSGNTMKQNSNHAPW